MNFSVKEHLPTDFNDNSRVWIYQASRLLGMGEAFELEDMLNSFVAGWQSHGAPVKGYANLFFGQFIVIMADETATGVSGCSTDSSVKIIKAAEERFGIQFFDRQALAFLVKDKVQVLPMNQLGYAVQNNFITPDTLYFNNTILTKKELETNWLIPVKDSWLAKRIQFTTTVP
ncbi:MAG TPA: hypothetical protein PKC39_10085 [Ferruginibacter sp.]|nr:hypothetical protein [Ferruginibacter sp.]HMP21298.1 hypothetical protein [Ferruginibacter sp.]